MRLPIAPAVVAPGVLGIVYRPTALAVFLTLAAAAAVIGASSNFLQMVGLPYGATGGNPLTKIHPASYIAVLAVLAWIPAAGGPARFLAETWRQATGALVLGLAILLLGYQAVAVQKMPASMVVDVFVLTLCLSVCLMRLDDETLRRAGLAVHVFFVVNSALGLLEYATGWRAIPFYDDGKVITFDWRSTAILGHPLINALVTGMYAAMLAGGAGPFRGPARLGLILFNLTAMIGFGGRSATVAALAVVLLFAGLGFARVLAGQRFRLRTAVAGVLLGSLVLTSGFVAVNVGAADRFLQRFEEDSGSAATRLTMFRLFDSFTTEEILLRPDPDILANRQRRAGLTIGIESYIVGFILYFGAFVTVFFFAGLAAFLAEVVRFSGTAALVPVLFYMVVSAGATGMSVKSTDFAVSTAVMLLVLGRRSTRSC